MPKLLSLTIVSLLFSFCCVANKIVPDDTLLYKQTKQGNLNLYVFYPNGEKTGTDRAVIVFFFGGGWTSGNPSQFYQQCKFYASHGVVAISADYRIKNRNNTTPFECVKDGKSAIRWVRSHSKELGTNPKKIIASGGSAGGHVAACTALIEGYEENGEDLSISSIPNALVLFNPVLDTTQKGYGSNKVKGKETLISPNHHIRANLPPTILFHGTSDHTVPFTNAIFFEKEMQKAGNVCELVPIKDADHGFFNGSYFRPKNGDKNFKLTMKKSYKFLLINLLKQIIIKSPQ